MAGSIKAGKGRTGYEIHIFGSGKGIKVEPLTSDMPKSMFKLGQETTLIARMVNLIRRHDTDADIVVVTGHKHRSIERSLAGVTFINNPFMM